MVAVEILASLAIVAPVVVIATLWRTMRRAKTFGVSSWPDLGVMPRKTAGDTVALSAEWPTVRGGRRR